jgi:hypothetical protein
VCVISIGDAVTRQATNPKKMTTQKNDHIRLPIPTSARKPELFSRNFPEDVYYALADAD